LGHFASSPCFNNLSILGADEVTLTSKRASETKVLRIDEMMMMMKGRMRRKRKML
jgi:hypothetical protein